MDTNERSRNHHLFAAFVSVVAMLIGGSNALAATSPWEVQKETDNVYGKFSISRDFVSRHALCPSDNHFQPAPHPEPSRFCQLTGPEYSRLEPTVPLHFQPGNPAFSRFDDPPQPRSAEQMSSRVQLESQRLSEKIIDLVYPGFGRWEGTVGGANVKINYLNVRRSRSRDGRQDVTVSINLVANF